MELQKFIRYQSAIPGSQMTNTNTIGLYQITQPSSKQLRL